MPEHCVRVWALCDSCPAGLRVGRVYSENVQRWRFPFFSILSLQPSFWLPLALAGGSCEWGGMEGGALQVLVILKASPEDIASVGRKAKFADVSQIRKRGLHWRQILPFYCFWRSIPGAELLRSPLSPPPSWLLTLAGLTFGL